MVEVVFFSLPLLLTSPLSQNKQIHLPPRGVVPLRHFAFSSPRRMWGLTMRAPSMVRAPGARRADPERGGFRNRNPLALPFFFSSTDDFCTSNRPLAVPSPPPHPPSCPLTTPPATRILIVSITSNPQKTKTKTADVRLCQPRLGALGAVAVVVDGGSRSRRPRRPRRLRFRRDLDRRAPPPGEPLPGPRVA